eukprot:1188088-Rhodomonas_salina.2
MQFCAFDFGLCRDSGPGDPRASLSDEIKCRIRIEPQSWYKVPGKGIDSGACRLGRRHPAALRHVPAT